MSGTSYATLEVSVKNKVCLICLNRVKKLNAFNGQQYTEVANALKFADNNPNVNVIVLTANGQYFSSGNDLSQFFQAFKGGLDKKQIALQSRELLFHFTKTFLEIKKPLIGGVNGRAIGIAVTILGLFDFVYANNTATFNTPFSALGQSPEGLSSYIFPKLMGLGKANEILMLGKKINAIEAKECNLVTDVWHCDQNQALFRQKLLAVAEQLASYPTQGLMKLKELIHKQDKRILEQVLNDECDLLVERWQSKECETAIFDFFMKQKMKKKNQNQSKL